MFGCAPRPLIVDTVVGLCVVYIHVLCHVMWFLPIPVSPIYSSLHVGQMITYIRNDLIYFLLHNSYIYIYI